MRMPRVTCAALAFVGAACAGRHGGTAARPDGSIKVLVYNVHAGKDAAGVDNLQRVADVVRGTGADVVLLQEVDKRTRRSGGVDQPAEYARRTGYHVAFGRSLDYDGGEYGIAVLSRWPLSRDTALHPPVAPPPARAGGPHEPRGAMRVNVASPVGDILVFNTHIDASGDDRWRKQEV